ncbi:MAG: dual specificity protein phosphatase family protein [Parachlamydiaceae bacterium]|nr:dual specificity protein phosphatase family protein [Parachlamydiaceae bacterium]
MKLGKILGQMFTSQPVIKSFNTSNTIEDHKNKGIKYKIAYQISLLYTLADRHINHDTHLWWNRIKDTNITLGAVPLKNRNHHTRIFNETLNYGETQKQIAVLTLLEPFEIFSKGLFSDPVTPKDWGKLGVNHKIISASDFSPLTQKQIEEAVFFLEEQDKQGIHTYVHCKAGRGRSATAVICFLMKKHLYTAEKAKEKVSESRNQININTLQWKAIKNYEAFLKLTSVSVLQDGVQTIK